MSLAFALALAKSLAWIVAAGCAAVALDERLFP